MRQVVVLSGRTCTGKSKLARLLGEKFGFHLIKTGVLLRKEAATRGVATDRFSLQELGQKKDLGTRHRWLFDEVLKAEATLSPDVAIVVDNVRNWLQLLPFRQNHKWRVIHVHLYAPSQKLEERFSEKRKKRPDEVAGSHVEADLIQTEEDIDQFKKDADIRIWTGWIDAEDALVRVAHRLGLYAPAELRCVDVIVGGQYGSEGKGHVSAYLAREYDVLMRVGGPNAGHTVSSGSGLYTYHHLPSGARDTDAEVLLGPGMTIRVPELLKEIEECNLSPGRLFIDPQAMIIEDEDIEAEEGLKGAIASTGRGGGAAAARRILMRKPGQVRLARDVLELSSFLSSTLERLEKAYREDKRVLLEGTQGSGLSLYHGQYPYVTSRDTNVAGCLAEAGISPTRVRRVLMVVRSTPIRVGNPDAGGSSGPLKYEITFDELAARAKLNADDLKSAEKTSTTKRQRRIGWFDWELFRRACALNAPTDIVLTFADYLHPQNREARRFEQLHTDTIKFIEELEAVSHAPVSLINTRFPRRAGERLDLRTVIDRRNWSGHRFGP